MLLFAMTAAGAVTDESPTGVYSREYSSHATRLRRDLLAPYDKVVAPSSTARSGYSKAGTDVSMQLRFFKVESVKASAGQMRLKVWMRLSWADERLSWDPALYGNVSYTTFQAANLANPEWTEIWLPDVQPYNAMEGIIHTLDPAIAQVHANGTVHWSRPGMLDIMCKFSGLVAFPFDKLKCAVEFGGWGMSGGQQGLELMGRGYDFSGLEGAAGTSYQEYTIERVDCWIEQNTEACCPGESWPVISYTVHLGRASYYYVRRSRGASNRRGETRVSPRLSGRSPVRARRAPRRSWW